MIKIPQNQSSTTTCFSFIPLHLRISIIIEKEEGLKEIGDWIFNSKAEIVFSKRTMPTNLANMDVWELRCLPNEKDPLFFSVQISKSRFNQSLPTSKSYSWPTLLWDVFVLVPSWGSSSSTVPYNLETQIMLHKHFWESGVLCFFFFFYLVESWMLQLIKMQLYLAKWRKDSIYQTPLLFSFASVIVVWCWTKCIFDPFD